jgi:hypothetical protein
MTDWGDAILNEKARPPTMPLPPDAAAREAERRVPRPEPPLTRHDKGTRIIPPTDSEEGGK